MQLSTQRPSETKGGSRDENRNDLHNDDNNQLNNQQEIFKVDQNDEDRRHLMSQWPMGYSRSNPPKPCYDKDGHQIMKRVC